MSVTIRRAREADIPRLLELERECFSIPWTERSMRLQLREKNIFPVAEEDGAVVGYAGAMTVLDEGYITNVAVAPEHRRRGIADALLDAMEAEARGGKALSFLTLEVRESNAPAIALYEKHGYRTVGRRKNYYQKPVEDALLMTLEFQKCENCGL